MNTADTSAELDFIMLFRRENRPRSSAFVSAGGPVYDIIIHEARRRAVEPVMMS